MFGYSVNQPICKFDKIKIISYNYLKNKKGNGGVMDEKSVFMYFDSFNLHFLFGMPEKVN